MLIRFVVTDKCRRLIRLWRRENRLPSRRSRRIGLARRRSARRSQEDQALPEERPSLTRLPGVRGRPLGTGDRIRRRSLAVPVLNRRGSGRRKSAGLSLIP